MNSAVAFLLALLTASSAAGSGEATDRAGGAAVTGSSPVERHLRALQTESISQSLNYVSEDVRNFIFSDESGRLFLPSGRRATSEMYAIAFGHLPGTIDSYACAPGTRETVCAIIINRNGERTRCDFHYQAGSETVTAVTKQCVGSGEPVEPNNGR